MKITKSIKRIPAVARTVLLAAGLCSLGQAFAADLADEKSAEEATMDQHCLEMMQQKKTLYEDIKVQNDKLIEQLTAMNLAPKEQKVELMAGVITNLVQQQITMDERKQQMEVKMMNHLMTHMSCNNKVKVHCSMVKDLMEIKPFPLKSGATRNEPQEEH
jgi:TolA-binding protein